MSAILSAYCTKEMKSTWMLVASFLFAVMGALVKLASEHFSSPELVFYRSIFGLLAIYLFIVVGTRQWVTPLVTRHISSHVKRGLSGFMALVMFFYAIAHLPLATAITLNYTAPLFLGAITGWWLKERHETGLVGALLFGFVGVAILLQPGWQGHDVHAAGIGLGSGFLAAIAYLNVRALGRQGEPEWRVVFYFTLIASLGAALWMGVAGFTRPRPGDWPLLLAMGLTATLAQLAMTRAYRLGNTLTVGTLAYSNVAFSAVYGVILFGDRLPLSAWLGMALIVLGGLFSAWFSRTATPAD